MNKKCKTNPISENAESNLICYLTSKYGNNPNIPAMQKRTQTNPILSARVADKISLSVAQSQRKRFMLTFPGNFLKYHGLGSVAQLVEQRTFNA